MTRSRKEQVCLDARPYYHCICRCVRRVFLCGDDKFTGQNFDHRKQWVVDKITMLSTIFTIDICAYAVMSNHYHLVLKS
jgi:REP element-mobilizing transposase RayT